MSIGWQDRSWAVHERYLAIAQGKGKLTSATEITQFLGLAICGEAGELANLLKKEWQGQAVDQNAIRSEIADLRIYLEHLCRHLHIDLDQECEQKVAIVEQRLDRK